MKSEVDVYISELAVRSVEYTCRLPPRRFFSEKAKLLTRAQKYRVLARNSIPDRSSRAPVFVNRICEGRISVAILRESSGLTGFLGHRVRSSESIFPARAPQKPACEIGTTRVISPEGFQGDRSALFPAVYFPGRAEGVFRRVWYFYNAPFANSLCRRNLKCL